MNLSDLVRRACPPEPWAEGEKIPWNDPAFSRRMLAEHLSQEHDAASRRDGIIDAQVDWIDRELLGRRPARVLDLGCGPGLYTQRLAARGHVCHGIDFGPASIEYARARAAETGAGCRYTLADVRSADYGEGYDLAMFLFGEFNVFRPDDTRLILGKCRAALRPGGTLLLEVSTYDCVRQIGQRPRVWSAQDHGLFSDLPHLYLYESYWDEARAVATERYYVVDADSGEVSAHAATNLAYTKAEWQGLLEAAGFADVAFRSDLWPAAESQRGLFHAIVARREA